MTDNIGGPFGAVIVKDNKMLSIACNQVTSTNDPTAHAEIVAIRQACIQINDFNLFGATLYTTCEPCPMCLGAIYWANIDTIFYCSTKEEAEKIGFADNHIYSELGVSNINISKNIHQIKLPIGKILFNEWLNKNDKTHY